MGSTTDSTRATVQEFLDRLAKGDPDHIAAMVAERIDWMIADNPGVPWIRPRSTRADVASHFRELAEGLVPEAAENTIDAIVVDGAEAMLTGRLTGVVRATGAPFRSPFAMRLTVEDGLISRYHVYEDGLAVAAACALPRGGPAQWTG